MANDDEPLSNITIVITTVTLEEISFHPTRTQIFKLLSLLTSL